MKGQVKDMFYGASNLLFKRAEELRKFCTWEEEIIWGFLKGNQLGIKFRRQHPLLFYVADFYCHQLKLIIEIDGSIHNKEDVKINDQIRQKEIEDLGITILRFSNSQVKHNPEIILEQINKKIEELKKLGDQSSPSGAGGQAMILAAGLGTRLKPWTDHHPKALVMVNGKSLLQRNIEYLQQFNINNIIVNVHHFSDQIIKVIHDNNGWGSAVQVSDETNEVLETGGGLKKAAPYLQHSSAPFVLMNADILTDLNLSAMLQFHLQHQPLATLAVTKRTTSRYLLFDEHKKMCGWLNEKTGEQKGLPGNKYAFSGIHIISPAIFSLVEEEGKFSMIDVYLRLAKNHTILGYDHSESLLLDVGKPESVALAEKLFS